MTLNPSSEVKNKRNYQRNYQQFVSLEITKLSLLLDAHSIQRKDFSLSLTLFSRWKSKKSFGAYRSTQKRRPGEAKEEQRGRKVHVKDAVRGCVFARDDE